MKRTGLYVTIPDGEVRWQIKQAALDERRTVRALVLDILEDWLRRHGYAESTPEALDNCVAEERTGCASDQ